MPKIKVLSWNVENFKADKQDEVAEIIKSYNPDVFGIYEVKSNSVYQLMKQHFPNYSVFITEGQQSQEILVACRNKSQYSGIKFQQKAQFKSGNPALRPGAFLTFEYIGKGQYNFLFLHTDSGKGAVDFGNRTEMFDHAYNLKRKLDYDNNGQPVNFMMLGDLNTMGLNYPKPYKSNSKVTTPEELVYLDFNSNRKSGTSKHRKLKPQIRRLTKPAGTYYSKTYGKSDLDHILASDHMQFYSQTNPHASGQFEVKLEGWCDFDGDEARMNEYVEKISDHCLLYCEVKV